jgi:dihydroorotate dehydrogenase (fumarate)
VKLDIEKGSVDELQQFKKPYIVSLSGLSLADNLEMLSRVYKTHGVAGIELNLACPNVPGKPMVAYDFAQMEEVLQAVCAHPDYGKIPLGVKLAPYLDMPLFDHIVSILVKYPIKYIVCINTIGNALVVDAENECEGIVPRQGLGGLGGGFVKHTALANVRIFYNLLHKYHREDIDIVGVGGIHTGKDAFEMILCGAKAVQVGTCHWTEGPGCFDRITKELEEIMKEKGYDHIKEFRGNLRPYIPPITSPKESDTIKKEEEELVIQHNAFDQKVFNPLTAALIGVIALLIMKICSME